MRAPGAAAATLWALLAWAGIADSVGAQEAEIFEINDFIDPRLLEPIGPDSPPLGFFRVRTDYGYIGDYQSRFGFTGENLDFAQVGGNLTLQRWQLGIEALRIGLFDLHDLAPEGSVSERERYSVELGRYFSDSYLVEVQAEEGKGLAEVEVHNRIRVGIERSELESGETVGAINLDWDWSTKLAPDFLNGWHYTLVEDREGDEGRNSHYLSFSSRGVVHRFDRGGKILLGLAFGGERTRGHTKFSSVRIELIGRIPIRFLGTELQLAWSPAWQPTNRDHASDWNSEIGFMVSHQVFTRLFERRRQR